MASIILLNKPYGVHSQFSGDDPLATLASLIDAAGFYPAGRLDKDSEGLLLLTDDGAIQHRISDPRYDKEKTYWAQVEGIINGDALSLLRQGVRLKDGLTKPAKASAIAPPSLWERDPPIRERKNIPTSWLELSLSEGKNRQVRRMTAAVGFPTLRLVRARIGNWSLDGMAPGESRKETISLADLGGARPTSAQARRSQTRGYRPR